MRESLKFHFSLEEQTVEDLFHLLTKIRPNDQWRALEERVGATTVDRHYTWGLRDRWDLLRRKRSVGGSLNETLYVLRDCLDPVAVAGTAGNIVERYAYDAFGNVRILTPDYTAPTSSVAWDFLFVSVICSTVG